jgi:hypothetical protein
MTNELKAVCEGLKRSKPIKIDQNQIGNDVRWRFVVNWIVSKLVANDDNFNAKEFYEMLKD